MLGTSDKEQTTSSQVVSHLHEKTTPSMEVEKDTEMTTPEAVSAEDKDEESRIEQMLLRFTSESMKNSEFITNYLHKM